jgi:hypothetical protein
MQISQFLGGSEWSGSEQKLRQRKLANSSVSFMQRSYAEAGDPNGIRTRVTAVKGRCPGPLDDRVIKARAISELPLFRARQNAGRI